MWHELRRRFAVREASDIARVAGVAELVRSEGCLVRRLLAYFGEELGRPCGHCGPCAGDPRAVLERAHTTLTFSRQELGALRAENPRTLSGARQVARFLCGITSPALSTAKLTRHPRFGSAAELSFALVLHAAKEAFAELPGSG